MNPATEYIIVVLSGTLVFLVVLVFFYIFLKLYRRKQYQSKLEKSVLQEQFSKQILQTQLEIQEQTFKTISQEIHDNIGQVLSLVKLNLNTVAATEPNQPKITDTRNLVSKAINDLRDLSRSLHGDRIAEMGLAEAIAAELKIVQNTGKFATALHTSGNPYKPEPQQEMVLFRIVQEALHNAIKHSNAANITVLLKYLPELLILTITDDGKGFSPEALTAAQKGVGLTSMQNRATLIGATCSIKSAQGKGTSITINLKSTTTGSGPQLQ